MATFFIAAAMTLQSCALVTAPVRAARKITRSGLQSANQVTRAGIRAAGAAATAPVQALQQ